MPECVSVLKRPWSGHQGEVITCASCDRAVCVKHRKGEYCMACVGRRTREGNPIPRRTWSHKDLVETVAELAEIGVSRQDVPARVRVSWAAVVAAHKNTGAALPARYYNPPTGRREDVSGGGTQEAQEELAGPRADGSALEAADYREHVARYGSVKDREDD